VFFFSKHNLAREHNQHFQISYRFGRTSLLHEPLLLVGAFFLFFLIAIVGVRVRLSISPDNGDEEVKDKQIRGYLLSLKSSYGKLQKGLKELLVTSERNVREKKGQVKQEQDSVKASISQAYNEMTKIKSGLEEVDSDLADQVGLIIRKSQDKEGFVKKLIEQGLMYRNNDIQKGVYETSKVQSEKNLREVEEELEAAVSELTDAVSN